MEEKILEYTEELVVVDEQSDWAGKSKWTEKQFESRLPDNFTPQDEQAQITNDNVEIVHIGNDEYPVNEEDINELETEIRAAWNNGEQCHCEESCGEKCSCTGDEACNYCYGEHQSFSEQDGIAQLDYDESDFEQIASRPIFLPEKHGTKKIYRPNKVKAKRDMAKKSKKINRG